MLKLSTHRIPDEKVPAKGSQFFVHYHVLLQAIFLLSDVALFEPVNLSTEIKIDKVSLGYPKVVLIKHDLFVIFLFESLFGLALDQDFMWYVGH